jgi:hypothetical protein
LARRGKHPTHYFIKRTALWLVNSLLGVRGLLIGPGDKNRPTRDEASGAKQALLSAWAKHEDRRRRAAGEALQERVCKTPVLRDLDRRSALREPVRCMRKDFHDRLISCPGLTSGLPVDELINLRPLDGWQLERSRPRGSQRARNRNSLIDGNLVLTSRPESAELVTQEPHFLPTWIRIHQVIEPISETYAWIATESGIELPQREVYLICKG